METAEDREGGIDEERGLGLRTAMMGIAGCSRQHAMRGTNRGRDPPFCGQESTP